MIINFENNKDCNCYRDLVLNPADRQSMKNFGRRFDSKLMSAAVKVHNKLLSAPNASIYNLTVSNDNKIQLKSGTPDKESLILKVRVQDAYRKFFNFYVSDSTGVETFCLTKDWTGQFDQISKIYVHDVNKHDYKK
ncbi:hypothetical protein B0A63_21920 [Flavobacterium johnsoniae UW101]|nr:hypothetical protein B0A63_21920 [Flavobacterium johnsoniae UW101]